MVIARALVCASLLASSAYLTQTDPLQAASELRTNAAKTSFETDVEAEANIVAEQAFRDNPKEALRAAEVIGVVQNDLSRVNQFMDWRVYPETKQQTVVRLKHRIDQVEGQLKIREGSSDGSDQASTSMDGAAGLLGIWNKPVAATALTIGSATYRRGLSFWNPAIPEPANDARRSIEKLGWALRQVRLHTPAGEVLRPQLASAGIDPDKPLNEQEAVVVARAREKSTKPRALLTKTINVTNNHVVNVLNQTSIVAGAAAPGARTAREIATADLREASGDAMAVAFAAQLFNRPEEARIAFGIADVTSRAAVAINPGELSTFAVTGNYFALALAVKGLLVKSKQPESPFPGLFAALEQLSKQIDNLGKSLKNDIARMDARLGALMEKVIVSQESISNDTTQIREQINVLQRHMDQFQAETRNEHLAIADLMLSKDDRGCLRYDGDGKALPPTTDFIWCRDVYMVRATQYSRNVLAKEDPAARRPLEMSDIREDFPLSFTYDDLAKKWNYPGLNAGALLPDPDTWMEATSSFLEILNNNPDQLRNVELKVSSDGVPSQNETIDSVIAAGNELAAFFDWASLSKGTARNETMVRNVTRTIDDLAASYGKLLDNLNRNLTASGMRIDLTKNTTQEIPNGASLNFEKGNQVRVCNAGVKPLITKSQTIWIDDHSGYHAGPSNAKLDSDMTHWASTFLKMDELQPGPKFKSYVARPAAWLELDTPQQYRVEPCLRSLVIEDLNMTGQPQATVNVAYDVYVHDLKQDTRALVQTLAATRKNVPFSRYAGFNLWSLQGKNWDIRSALMIQVIWQDMVANWPEMQNVPLDPKDASNLKSLTDRAEGVLAQRREDIEATLHLEDLSRQIEIARRRIAAEISAGSNSRTATAERFVRTLIQDSEGLSAPNEIVRRVLSGQTTFQAEAARVQGLIQQLKIQLDELVEKNYGSPAARIIATRIRELEDIRALRATLAKSPTQPDRR